MSLIRELQKEQGDATQAQFAATLGIDQTTLSKIYSGDRNISKRVARRITQRCPWLATEVVKYLLSEPESADTAAG